MRALVALALICSLLAPRAADAQAAPERAADERAIRMLLEGELARLYGSTTAAAADTMARLWTVHGTHGGVLGTAPGRGSQAAIQQMWTAGMTRRPPDYARRMRLAVSAIQWIRPDIAAVDAAVTYAGGTRPDGTPDPESKEALYAVLVREPAGWRIAASRVAPLAAAAQPGR